MRDILFRGKRKDNGEWVEGFYICVGEKYHYILTGKLNLTKYGAEFEKYRVYSDTVGQFIGLMDKNGTKIFEDDIVEFPYLNPCSGNKETNRGEVIYSSEIAAFTVEGDYLLGELSELKVIGNIHDNPELLEVK